MTVNRSLGAALIGVLGLATPPALVRAQDSPPAGTIEHIVPPGANYDKAVFRLWVPGGDGPLRGTVVLVPGSASKTIGKSFLGGLSSFLTTLLVIGVR